MYNPMNFPRWKFMELHAFQNWEVHGVVYNPSLGVSWGCIQSTLGKFMGLHTTHSWEPHGVACGQDLGSLWSCMQPSIWGFMELFAGHTWGVHVVCSAGFDKDPFVMVRSHSGAMSSSTDVEMPDDVESASDSSVTHPGPDAEDNDDDYSDDESNVDLPGI